MEAATPSTVYKVTPSDPGSDVAAETAAALAASSLLFSSKTHPAGSDHYSNALLHAAEKAFHFANSYRAKYSDSPLLHSAVCPFYCSYSGYLVTIFILSFILPPFILLHDTYTYTRPPFFSRMNYNGLLHGFITPPKIPPTSNTLYPQLLKTIVTHSVGITSFQELGYYYHRLYIYIYIYIFILFFFSLISKLTPHFSIQFLK